jgi:signal transduction histidine kinase
MMVQSILRIILPQFLVMVLIAGGSFLVYQRIVISLLIDRDRQLAVISASRISQALEDAGLVLESIVEQNLQGESPVDLSELHLHIPLETLKLFNAGILVVDMEGRFVAGTPADVMPIPSDISGEKYFQQILHGDSMYFSDVLADRENGRDMIILSVPVYSQDRDFLGALIGAMHFETSPLSSLVKGLKVGDEGFAYLVDSEGRVIYHPEPENIGENFTGRPFVENALKGLNGGSVETLSTGERLVVGYAPIDGQRWGLIVRETWEEVIGPVRVYGLVIFLIITAITVMTTALLWSGVRRIANPIRELRLQAQRVGSEGLIEPVVESGISEVDDLSLAFNRMAIQIASYRTGLRRYLKGITQSQDEERRRVSRELHDETIQNLLAIDRQLELMISTGEDQGDEERLTRIHEMLLDTIQGVRQISRNLRPLVLEDLGLIPAIQSLIASYQEEAPELQIELRVTGRIHHMSVDDELALYRIIQEALTNCRKHADATKVLVDLVFNDRTSMLSVSDDGRGFDLPDYLADFASSGHYGLIGIRERTAALGGTFSVQSQKGSGTRLEIVIPLEG